MHSSGCLLCPLMAAALLCASGAACAQDYVSPQASEPAGSNRIVPEGVQIPAPEKAVKPGHGDRPSSEIAISKADRKLHKSVSRALARSQGIDASNVEVRAANGKVFLQGTVPEGDQKIRAGEIAAGTSGVKSVNNALTVKPVEK